MMRTITIQPDNTIVAGCFHGNFDGFKQAVVAKYGKDYGSYSMRIKVLNMALKYRLAQMNKHNGEGDAKR